MRRIILDASVLVAAMAKDGTARRVLLGAQGVHFVAPPDMMAEAEAKIPKLAARRGVWPRMAAALLDRVRSRVTVLPYEALADVWAEAAAIARAAHAEGDEAYIAAWLLLKAPIWSYDQDFDRVPGMVRVHAGQVLHGGG